MLGVILTAAVLATLICFVFATCKVAGDCDRQSEKEQRERMKGRKNDK